MRWHNKITDKKAAYSFIEAHRARLTLEELAEEIHKNGFSKTKICKSWVGQICRRLGIKDRPYRPRYSRLKSKLTDVAPVNL